MTEQILKEWKTKNKATRDWQKKSVIYIDQADKF